MARELSQGNQDCRVNPERYRACLRAGLLDVAIYGAPAVFPDVKKYRGNPNWRTTK